MNKKHFIFVIIAFIVFCEVSCVRKTYKLSMTPTCKMYLNHSKDSIEYRLKHMKFILNSIMGDKINKNSLNEAFVLVNYLQLLDPYDPTIYFSKGLILERQGHRDRAIHYYQKTRSLYNALGADSIYYYAINRAGLTLCIGGRDAYNKELDEIWKKHEHNVYKDWRKCSKEGWHFMWHNMNFKELQFMTLAPCEVETIHHQLYGLEEEDKK